MFSHVFVGADDVAVSKKFYDAVLGAIGVPEGKADPRGRVYYRTPSGVFGITRPTVDLAGGGADAAGPLAEARFDVDDSAEALLLHPRKCSLQGIECCLYGALHLLRIGLPCDLACIFTSGWIKGIIDKGIVDQGGNRFSKMLLCFCE
jgi:hypothetical protein